MTKAKANKLMLEHSRDIVAPSFANKIVQAYGQSLKSLGIKAYPAKEFEVISYNPKALSVSMYEVAQALCQRITGVYVQTMMNGRGSGAQDITEKAVAKLEAMSDSSPCKICGATGYCEDFHPIA